MAGAQVQRPDWSGFQAGIGNAARIKHQGGIAAAANLTRGFQMLAAGIDKGFDRAQQNKMQDKQLKAQEEHDWRMFDLQAQRDAQANARAMIKLRVDRVENLREEMDQIEAWGARKGDPEWDRLAAELANEETQINALTTRAAAHQVKGQASTRKSSTPQASP
jgi:hypothetical protein